MTGNFQADIQAAEQPHGLKGIGMGRGARISARGGLLLGVILLTTGTTTVAADASEPDPAPEPAEHCALSIDTGVEVCVDDEHDLAAAVFEVTGETLVYDVAPAARCR